MNTSGTIVNVIIPVSGNASNATCKFSSLIECKSSLKLGTCIPLCFLSSVQNALLHDINAANTATAVKSAVITP
jgi:hypothetical protein